MFLAYNILGFPDVFSVNNALDDMNAKNSIAMAAQETATEASKASVDAKASGDGQKADEAAKAAQLAASEAYTTAETAKAAGNVFFARFDQVYLQVLLIWAAYELLMMLIFKGRTVGKLLFKLAVVSHKEGASTPVYVFKLLVRSIIKFVFIYVLQGIPFIIACLTIFANEKGRSGVDIFARTTVADKRVKRNEPA